MKTNPWKITFIIIGVAIVVIFVSLLVLKSQLKKEPVNEDPDTEEIQEPELVTEVETNNQDNNGSTSTENENTTE